MAEPAVRWFAHDEHRPGQKEMVEDGISALQEGRNLIACAPTGVGKTAAALSAGIDTARRRNKRTTVLFLTGRQSQHRIAVETVRQLNERRPEEETPLLLSDLLGQQAMCVRPIRKEPQFLFSRLCAEDRQNRRCAPYLEKDEAFTRLIAKGLLHADEAVKKAVELPTPICAWRVAREAAGDADVVIADYNHLFIERIRKVSLEAMGLDLQDCILIIDEGHNLPDRIRSGLRRILTPDLLRDARQELEMERLSIEKMRDDNPDQAERRRQIMTASEHLRRWRKELERWIRRLLDTWPDERREDRLIVPEELLNTIERRFEETLDAESATKGSDTQRSQASFSLDEFINVLEEISVISEEEQEESASHRLASTLNLMTQWRGHPALAASFARRTNERERADTGRFIVSHLDPGLVSGPIFDQVAGSIVMSATLHPTKMYQDQMGLKDAVRRTYTSPFPPKRRPILVTQDVTLRFRDRNPSMLNRVMTHLDALIEEAPDNVAVFIPSYSLMDEILIRSRWSRQVIAEQPEWTKADADGVLPRLEKARQEGQPAVLIGTYGGRLAEGMDYHANLLCAVACIGIPIAPPSAESDALRSYLGRKMSTGKVWRHSVVQPAVNRVLQAMGRAIRKAEDRALILLVDSRHLDDQHRPAHPDPSQHLTARDANVTSRLAKRFFGRHPEALES